MQARAQATVGTEQITLAIVQECEKEANAPHWHAAGLRGGIESCGRFSDDVVEK